MMKSFPIHILAGTVALSFVAVACSSDVVTETGPGPRGDPISPSPTGPVTSADNRRSFIWTYESGFTILPNPPGVTLVSAVSINDEGEVSGTAIMSSGSPGPIYRAFKWSRATGFIFLPGVDTTDSYATGLDDDGNVVGYTESQTSRGVARSVVVWNKSNELRTLDVRLPRLHTLGIRAGWLFGTDGAADRNTPFRMKLASGRYEPLPALSGGGVAQVNASGAAVGFDGDINSGFGGSSDAVAWDEAGTRTVALACNGEWNCFAYLWAISANGIAVGSVSTAQDSRVFRWTRDSGVEYLTDPSGGGGSLSLAGLTDDGSILGSNGKVAFIIKPSGPVTFIQRPAGYSLIGPRSISRNGRVVGMLF